MKNPASCQTEARQFGAATPSVEREGRGGVRGGIGVTRGAASDVGRRGPVRLASGSVEVGIGAHISKKEERTGRIAIALRSGVRYAAARWPHGPRQGDSGAGALPPPLLARQRPMTKGTGTHTPSMARRMGKARHRKKQPIATAHAWCTRGMGSPRLKGRSTANERNMCHGELRSIRCSAQWKSVMSICASLNTAAMAARATTIRAHREALYEVIAAQRFIQSQSGGTGFGACGRACDTLWSIHC